MKLLSMFVMWTASSVSLIVVYVLLMGQGGLYASVVRHLQSWIPLFFSRIPSNV